MRGLSDRYYAPPDPPVYVGTALLGVERDWPFVGEDAGMIYVTVEVSQDKWENFLAVIAEVDEGDGFAYRVPRADEEIELTPREVEEAIVLIAEGFV